MAQEKKVIRDYRDSRYPSDEPVEVRWRDETFDRAELTNFGRNFEMALRWASERDILTRRFRWWEAGDIRTYMFEGDVTHGAMVQLFQAFLATHERAVRKA